MVQDRISYEEYEQVRTAINQQCGSDMQCEKIMRIIGLIMSFGIIIGWIIVGVTATSTITADWILLAITFFGIFLLIFARMKKRTLVGRIRMILQNENMTRFNQRDIIWNISFTGRYFHILIDTRARNMQNYSMGNSMMQMMPYGQTYGSAYPQQAYGNQPIYGQPVGQQQPFNAIPYQSVPLQTAQIPVGQPQQYYQPQQA